MSRKLLAALAAAAVLSTSAPTAAQTGMRYSDGFTFLKAVRERDGTKATELLNGARGAIVANTRSTDTGEGALHILVKGRDLTWLGFLLSKGARPDLKDEAGNTPLGIASQLGWIEGAQVLLQRGAKVDEANGRGETPLILAVQARSAPMVRLLLSRGASRTRTDSIAGYSALDYAKRDQRAAAILKILEEDPAAAKPKDVAGPVL